MICRQRRKEFSQYRDSHVYAVSKCNSHSWGLCVVPMAVTPSQLQTHASLFSFVMLGWDPAKPMLGSTTYGCYRKAANLEEGETWNSFLLMVLLSNTPAMPLYPGGAVPSYSSSWILNLIVPTLEETVSLLLTITSQPAAPSEVWVPGPWGHSSELWVPMTPGTHPVCLA